MTIHIIALHLAFGGVEKAIVNMANLFAERFDVEIISVYKMPNSPAYALDERVRVRYLLKSIPNREEWKSAAADFKPLRLLKESVKGVNTLVGKRLSVIRAIRQIRDGVIITTRHEDNIALSRYGNKGVLKIAQLHHDHRFEKQYVNAFKKDYSNIDYFTVLTPGLAEEVGEMMKGTKTRVVNIPNFIDNIPEHIDQKAKEKVVVAAGRLHPMKRFDVLIRIFASIHASAPDWKLRIIGEGEMRPELERLITENHAEEYIELTGAMGADGVQEEMLHAGIYAMSSSSEGFAFVIIEAQSCALPVVAFDVRVGPPYLIEDGKDGFLVADNDEKAYGEKLLRLMKDDGLRERMGQAGREHAPEFSKEKIAHMWYEILGE